MNNNINTNTSYNPDDELDFRELFQVIWQGKWIVVAIVTFFSITAIIYSLSLPNIYQSKALLSPVAEQGGSSGGMQGIGGLAGIAGISLPQSGGNAVEAIDKLGTLSFFTNNILPNIFLPDLMALDYWDASTQAVIYDENYNQKTQTWTQIPSAQESFMKFKAYLSVNKKKKTGFVTISVKHQSPVVAQAWTELIVRELNEFFRVKDKAEATAAMEYLNAQMTQTSFAQIKQVIAQLLQQKIQQLTLIEVRDFYVFDYIDPPAVMEFKSEPARSIICIISALLGALLGVFVVLIRHFSMEKKPNNSLT
jgi:LPS O-antigen subunit length determinant protein (WzzB/FepE family)